MSRREEASKLNSENIDFPWVLEQGKGIGRDSVGFKPTAGQRSNQLNYVPAGENAYKWWAVQGSNLRPPACKAGALTN